jgi:hypothetical protein
LRLVWVARQPLAVHTIEQHSNGQTTHGFARNAEMNGTKTPSALVKTQNHNHYERIIMDYSFLWRDDVDEDELVECYQQLINTGTAWRLEGSVGRTAMDLIESGRCALGEEGHRDYWGNYVPSRHEVEPGTKGSIEFVEAHA